MNNKIKISLPDNVKAIINNLYESNHEAFAVGGCVRDTLLGRKPTDWDITTSATPEEMKGIFEKFHYKIIETGIKHGTLTVVINKEAYEITTYRVDGDYLDNRRPAEVFFTRDLKGDLKRRDFTINAMAYNHVDGLIDYNNGLEHLKMKRLCTVGDAEHRFKEDALRMLRAVRFSSVLNFSMDKEIEKAIINNSNLLKNISVERIREELVKTLLSPLPVYGINKLCRLQLMNYIIPEMQLLSEYGYASNHTDKNIFHHTMLVLENVENTLIQRLAALLHDVDEFHFLNEDTENSGGFYRFNIIDKKVVSKILIALRFDNNTINKVSLLVNNHKLPQNLNSQEDIKNFIIKVGEENLNDVFKLAMAHNKSCHKSSEDCNGLIELQSKCYEILKNREPLYIKDLLICGNDLIKLGVPKGKLIGCTLSFLRTQVLKNPENNKKEILIELAKKYCKL